jgi:hypothetical protein
VLGGLAAAAAGALALASAASPPAPAQPILFSHRIHAGDNAIGCTSCHTYAERGPVAGVPSVERCQGCHKFIKQDREDPSLNPQIDLLEQKVLAKQPIEWVRVHRVPDHVFFTHQPHVLAGVRCQECHGEVEKMDVIRQVAPLTMGWCLECHRRKQAERPVALAKLTDCWTCHK